MYFNGPSYFVPWRVAWKFELFHACIAWVEAYVFLICERKLEGRLKTADTWNPRDIVCCSSDGHLILLRRGRSGTRRISDDRSWNCAFVKSLATANMCRLPLLDLCTANEQK